jgi:regulator of replication initiation timing
MNGQVHPLASVDLTQRIERINAVVAQLVDESVRLRSESRRVRARYAAALRAARLRRDNAGKAPG